VTERKGIENVGGLVRMLDEDDEELAQVPAGAPTVMKILADQIEGIRGAFDRRGNRGLAAGEGCGSGA
jgi:hypothetical protein